MKNLEVVTGKLAVTIAGILSVLPEDQRNAVEFHMELMAENEQEKRA